MLSQARFEDALTYVLAGKLGTDEVPAVLLRQIFTLAADRLREIAALDVSPAEKVDRVIAGMAALVGEHSYFPAIMMREVAEGGAHLDRAHPGAGVPGGPPHRLVQAGALEHVEAGDLLLGLGERAVADQQFAAAYAHGRGLARRPQRAARHLGAAALHLRDPIAHRRRSGRTLRVRILRRVRRGLLVQVVNQQEPHRASVTPRGPR